MGQSLRHGSQTAARSAAIIPIRAIRALFAAIDAPIRAHIAAIGEGGQNYAFDGAWSVRLNSGGFHINHVHPEGWLSSAFYVRLPGGMSGQEGWLKFGEPGPPTSPPLPAEHLVKPEPGLLVLFPVYMWHGTVPFAADDKRLTCAFDIVRQASKIEMQELVERRCAVVRKGFAVRKSVAAIQRAAPVQKRDLTCLQAEPPQTPRRAPAARCD